METPEELAYSQSHLESWGTLAYWLGFLRPGADLSNTSADALGDALTGQYSMEDQKFGDEYSAIDPFTDEWFQPISPVTLARRWCPIRLARELLGDPVWADAGTRHKVRRPIASVWDDFDPEALWDAVSKSEDSSHFLFLLGLTIESSIDVGGCIMLVCSPGWSFDSAAQNPLGSFGISAMKRGRLYPERVPSGAIRIEQGSGVDP